MAIAAHTDGTLCADATLHTAECPRRHTYAPAWTVTWRASFGGECRATLDGVSFQGIDVTSTDGWSEYRPTGLFTSVQDLLSELSAIAPAVTQ